MILTAWKGAKMGMKTLAQFMGKLDRHARRKAVLYDGINVSLTPQEALIFATEELGEVAGALTRERWELAMAECLDVAHCAFLIYYPFIRYYTPARCLVATGRSN